ncbi:spore maturation protein SpmA [Chitinivorax tropicus]|uniref:Spore maturation protein SpmA n=1 Tax=Chitinivorax tropicus TaxID=714531 RepID=A0A840MRE0_9PROT|nr:spore maturation protein [Chitinivorax tropicus]MBB5019006.1 spore maturation protein SpmA [Chitinivorax tropicus]
MLNILWASFIVLAFMAACVQAFLLGHTDIFGQLTKAMFDSAKNGFEIALGLTGVMTLWLGLLKIGEQAGFIEKLARGLAPLFRRLLPEVPAGHPALGSITMNMAANMLGLDNAATPLGLKAMQELQTLNPSQDTASNAQIMFLVINTASVTLFPVTIMAYRAQMGAANPADVFVPLLIASFCGTLAGIIVTGLIQRIRLFDPVLLLWLGGWSALLATLATWLLRLSAADMQQQTLLLSNAALMAIVVAFVGGAWLKGVNVYETFVEGAKDGFATAVRIIPYLVAMLFAIALFRASGALDLLINGIRHMVAMSGLDTRWVDALPTGLMKTLSGSGARAMMLDTLKVQGADSFAGRLVSILQGSSETTFYVLAVYFGSVGIRRARHALACGLIADLASFVAAVGVAYAFFG